MELSYQIYVVFILLVIFQAKHFLADYPLQGTYMLGKFKEKGWILPLLAHASVHGIFTFLITVLFVSFPLALLLGIFDTIVHFTIDRIKASPKLLGRYKVNQTQFWIALGADQTAHHLTHYAIIFVVVFVLFAI